MAVARPLDKTFTKELARAPHRPAILPVPAALLCRLAGDLADELLIGGQRVVPDKADASGFTFRHPTIRPALAAILGPRPAHPAAGHHARWRYFGGRMRARSLSLRSSLAELAARHRLSDDRLLR